MKTKRVFDPQEVLADARAGRLSGAAIRRAISTAEELGNEAVADQLRKYAASAVTIATDSTPPYLRDRMERGIQKLAALGEPNKRAKQLLRQHGVIETLNRMACTPLAERSYGKLRTAGFKHLSADSIILSVPHLFQPDVVEVARRRLGR